VAERQTWQAQGRQQAEVDRDQLNALAEQRIEAERRAWHAAEEQRAVEENLRRHAESEQRLENERRVWRAEAEHRVEAERRRCEAETLIALGKAEEQWKAQEADRAAALRDELRQQAERLLAQEADKSRRLEANLVAEADKSRKLEAALEALVQAKSAAPGNHGQELVSLRGELAKAQACLAERESELVRLRTELEQEGERRHRDAQAALEAATRAAKAEESTRLDAALAQAQVQAERALAEMAARCEQAELALAEARSRPAAEPDDGYVEGLRAEVQELRKALTNQEVELGWARAALDESKPLHVRKVGENLPITNFQGPDEQPEDEQDHQGAKSNLVRDCLLVAGLVIPLIVFYPWIAAYLPANVQNGIASVTGGLLSVNTERPASVAPHIAAPVAAAPAPRPTVTLAKSAKLRATPAVKGSVVVTLPKGASVLVLEQQGNWTRIEAPAKDAAGKAQQGWVYGSALEKAEANGSKPPAAKSGDVATAKPAAAKPEAAQPSAVQPNLPPANSVSPNAPEPVPAPVKADAVETNAATPSVGESGAASPSPGN
jgi:hypothetical protein